MHASQAGCGAAVVLAGLLVSARASADETITDGEFADADWTIATVIDGTSDGSASFTGLRQTTGGNPGAQRLVSNAWTGDGLEPVTTVGAHLYSAADYTPTTQGAIGTVEFSFDVRTTATTYPTEAYLDLYPVLTQSDATYLPQGGVEALDAWDTWSSGQLDASDFARYAGDPSAPDFPDFSASAPAITFGFAVSIGPHTLAGTYETEGGVDNFSVTVRDPGSSAGGAGGAGGSSGGTGGTSQSGAGLTNPGNPGGVPPRPDGGCGCRQPAGSAPAQASWPWVLVALGSLAACRRRRGR